MQAASESRDKARKRLRKKLSGDLDSIILMALRKEPHRRYLSVEQFSDDIGRYLAGRPVIARRDTPGYRLAKFVRRNALAVTAAVVIGIALISIAAVSRHAAAIATAARQKAEQTLRETRHELIAAQQRAGDASAAYTAAQLAYNAHPGDPLARRDLAQTAQLLASQREAAGAHAEAQRFYQEALTQYEALTLGNPHDAGAQRDVMTVANTLGALQRAAGDVPGAIASYTRALQIAEGLAAMEGSQITPATRQEVASANRRVGELLVNSGAKDAGQQKLRRALEIYRELADNSAVDELARQLAP
jgi:tetratricopeptide (TPR) repeat protein